jgi:DNA-directed RNA polymerase subunit omega
MSKLLTSKDLGYKGSCYSLVIAVAKRARNIAEEAEQERHILTKKPVQIAMEELAEGRATIVETGAATPAIHGLAE